MGIILKSVSQSFGQPPTQVLYDISLEIKDGEFVSITGRSGSGKSTLLYLISTLDRAKSGVIEIDTRNVGHMNTRELHQFRNLTMGFVFQFHHLLPELTAVENVLMPALKTEKLTARKKFALELLEEFGIQEKADRYPSQLSGGEQQRVAIARALIMQPKYIFADEPTGNLDSINGNAVMKLLDKVNQERGTTIIFVTHDKEFAGRARRQIEVVDGRIFASHNK